MNEVRLLATHRWAQQVIEREAAPSHAFIDVASVPADDLSALRYALWPLVREPEPPEVLHAGRTRAPEEPAGPFEAVVTKSGLSTQTA